MNERLIVRDFLCLKDIDIEVKDFLVLIGPQAAGKSLCAKLLYFFRTIFVEMTVDTMKSALDKRSDLNKNLLDKFESFFPKDHWITQEFYMEYEHESRICFRLEKKQDQELTIYVEQRYQRITQEIKQLFQTDMEPDKNHEESKKFLKILENNRLMSLSSKNIFVPAGRSFFSLLQKNIFRFLQTNNNIDPFLMDFGVFYEDIRPIRRSIPAEARILIHSILKGDYVPEENLLFVDCRRISLELLSSGQQEVLPLTLVFDYIFSLHLTSHDFTNIYVEEPEAHLFPDAQEAMSRLISFLQHNTEWQTTFFITTHSPYMLAAFNNLIKAGNIVKQNPALKEAVCKAIPESMHIDIERFAAYTLEDGRAVSIIDNETNLINADAIDSVSESIMEIFNTLQDIEFGNGKAGEHV